jgi:hypothetical protein
MAGPPPDIENDRQVIERHIEKESALKESRIYLNSHCLLVELSITQRIKNNNDYLTQAQQAQHSS